MVDTWIYPKPLLHVNVGFHFLPCAFLLAEYALLMPSWSVTFCGLFGASAISAFVFFIAHCYKMYGQLLYLTRRRLSPEFSLVRVVMLLLSL